MSNAHDHAWAAAAFVGACHVGHEQIIRGQVTVAPVLTALLAAKFDSLPDVLEPAIHPNHRQFFHSIVFAGVVVCAGKKVYDWSPTTPFEKAVRIIALTAGGAYLAHLLLDAQSPKSIPFIGRIGGAV